MPRNKLFWETQIKQGNDRMEKIKNETNLQERVNDLLDFIKENEMEDALKEWDSHE